MAEIEDVPSHNNIKFHILVKRLIKAVIFKSYYYADKIKIIKREDKDQKSYIESLHCFFKGCTKSQDGKNRRTRRTRNIGRIDIFGYSLETFKAAYTICPN